MSEREQSHSSDEADREEMFCDARSWAVDDEDRRRRSTTLAWTIAAIATTVALLEALALIGLTPLKTVVPYTVLVDRTTGFVQVLEGTQPQKVSPSGALTQSMLAQYIIARETFDVAGLAEQYRKVALWSGGDARREYLALMPTSNPLSPLNIYPRTSLVTTAIESVTPIGQDGARVRFVTERRDQNQAYPQRLFWVAQLRYRYSGEPMSLEDRLANPLGFQVIDYRKDQEVAPQQVASPPAVASPQATPAIPTGAM